MWRGTTIVWACHRFSPPALRFEDFIYRLWIQQPGIASAHVDAVQTHIANNYMRNPLAMDVFNERDLHAAQEKDQVERGEAGGPDDFLQL